MAMSTTMIEAVEARDAMERALMQGGKCTVEVGTRKRTLVHDPTLDGPLKKLPWPLELFQEHTVRYVVYDDERLVSGHIFVRRQMKDAIDYFLRDVQPHQKVAITLK
jgi:hypothetical protein